MLLNSLDFFEGDYDLSTDQVNFNLESLDLSFLEGLELQNLLDQFDVILENYGGVLNATISEDELRQLLDIFSAFTLANDSHYTTISIQYEGLNDGIRQISPNQYEFDLWEAMGYAGESLSPSEKIYIALAGAFMSEIDINILQIIGLSSNGKSGFNSLVISFRTVMLLDISSHFSATSGI